jgi:hypothetical protein
VPFFLFDISEEQNYKLINLPKDLQYRQSKKGISIHTIGTKYKKGTSLS